MRPIREQAHRLQDLGYRLVPLEPGGKRPILRRWQETRSTHEQIDQWFASCGNINIGIHTGLSGVVVADCDSEVAAEWVASNLTQSPMFQHTPRGGLHVFFRDGGNTPNRINLMGIKLDIRAKLSQVVVSPSR